MYICTWYVSLCKIYVQERNWTNHKVTCNFEEEKFIERKLLNFATFAGKYSLSPSMFCVCLIFTVVQTSKPRYKFPEINHERKRAVSPLVPVQRLRELRPQQFVFLSGIIYFKRTRPLGRISATQTPTFYIYIYSFKTEKKAKDFNFPVTEPRSINLREPWHRSGKRTRWLPGKEAFLRVTNSFVKLYSMSSNGKKKKKKRKEKKKRGSLAT